jgi:hypothetical protein
MLRERFCTIALVWADGGFAGRLVSWAAGVLRVEGHRGQTQRRHPRIRRGARRWILKRTFGWLMRHRRPGPRLRAAA